jgi:RHS repeat-associated protein
MRSLSRGAAIAARPLVVVGVCLLLLADGRAMRVRSGDGPHFDPVGLQADRGYFSELPWEFVDLANGNVIAKYTDLVLPGNAGMTLKFVRQYNAATRQWQFGLDGIPIFGPQQDDPEECCDYPVFSGVGIEEKSFPENGQMGSTTVFLTRQFWRFTWAEPPAISTLQLPNGWVGTYDAGLLQELRDPFDNSVTLAFTTGMTLESVTQHLSGSQTRTVTYGYDANRPTSMTYGTKTWTYEWTGLNLISVQPPEGPAWNYAYTTQTPAAPCDAAPPNYSTWPGTFQVTTPYGGVVEYTFAVRHVEPTAEPPECHAVLATREMSGPGLETAEWMFDIPLTWTNPDWTKTSTVTTPEGRTVTYTHTTHHSISTQMGQSLSSQFLIRKEIAGAAVVERTPTFLDYVGGLTEPVIAQQRVTVDSIVHQTDFAYDDPGAGLFDNYHRPYRTTECQASGATCVGPTRTTTRVFKYGFTPYLIGPLQEETVLVSGDDEYGTSHVYDMATGFQTKRTVNGIETDYTPDTTGTGNGNVGQETGAITTSFSYEWGVLKDTIRPLSTTSRAINPDGTVASETVNWGTTNYIYDDIGRPETMSPPVGENAETDYDDELRTVEVCRGSQCTVTVHDGIGRPLSVTNPAGITTTTEYDKDGRKSFESYPGGGNNGDHYTYDALNRVTEVKHADDSTRTMEYGLPAYGANSVKITDENNHVTIQWFEAFGDPFERRLVKLRDARAEGSGCSGLLGYSGDCEWEYAYTTLGALKSVNPPAGGPMRTWDYDSRHLLTSEHQPESGTTEYEYDPDGRLTLKKPAGQADLYLRHWYDENGRLRRIDQDPATAHWVEFGYDDADNRTRVQNALVDSRFTYDAANRLTKREDIIGTRTFVTTYTYDGKDHLTEILYPSGRKVIYAPNASTGRIESVTGPGGVNYATSIQYHPSGAISGLTFGNDTPANPVKETVVFDPERHWPTQIVSGPVNGPAADRLDLTYGYDEVGNVEAIVDPRPGKTSNFGYDELDRLEHVSDFGALDYEYDPLGNRTWKRFNGGAQGAEYKTDGPTQRLTEIISALGAPETGTFTYDAVGNTTADGTGEYEWSPFNTMTSAEVGSVTTEYGYDGEGQRKRKAGPNDVRLYIHGPGGQLLAEYKETPSGPELVREYIYLGSKLIASSTRVDPPVPTGRVTGVTASPLAQKYGTSITITVTGWTTPCSQVQVDFGDGTVTPYPIASPYQLPLQVTHTYAAAGLYNVVVTGQTGASGPCVGTVSMPLEVTSGNVVTNGDFTQVDGNGNPVSWGIYSQGGPAHWWLDNGIKFYRTGAAWQAVVLQYTGLELPDGAPLEATFTMGNTDTVKKRLLMLIHNDTSDDLAACSFWLDANQTPQAYTMRMHTTKAWTNATISFYAAEANAPSSQGAYHLNNVTLEWRPAGNSAKTECVDPLVPTEGDIADIKNLIVDADFDYTYQGWWTFQGQDAVWVNEPGQPRAEFRRKTSTPPPAVRQSHPTWSGVVPARQRVQLTFELRNQRTTRQRVNVTLQDASGGAMAFCTFWLPPSMLEKELFAMTTYAAAEWPALELVVSPQTVGEPQDEGWIQFDTVILRKTDRPMPGTECWEPGSFTVDPTGFIVSEWPQPPAPVPAPEPDMDALAVEDDRSSVLAGPRSSVLGPRSEERADAGQLSSDSFRDDVTFHPEHATPASGPSAETEPVRTDPLTVIIGGTASGTVTSSPGGIACAGSAVSCTGWFAEGTVVALTATPDSGLVFVGWAGACTGTTQPCDVTMDGAKSVVAHFASPLEFYHLDVLGSVRMMTDAVGNVVIRHDYFAFGEDIQGPEGDPRRFTGKERDAETELHYFGARYFRSVWGRFMSPDPGQASGSPEDPQGWNAYAYARNNPLRFIDPDGLSYQVHIYGRPGIIDVNSAIFEKWLKYPSLNPGISFTGEAGESGWIVIGGQRVGYYTFTPDKKADPYAMYGAIREAGRRAEAGVTAALVISAPNAVLMLGTLAPAGAATTLYTDVGGLMSSHAINVAIGSAQRALLRTLFTTGRVPPGLTAKALRLYRTIAERAVRDGRDASGVQAFRLWLIDKALKAIGG